MPMDLLTSVQAADRLGISHWHVAKLARTGKLTPAVKAPGPRGAFLFDPATVADYAKSRGKA